LAASGSLQPILEQEKCPDNSIVAKNSWVVFRSIILKF
jgi:hypothetical protein